MKNVFLLAILIVSASFLLTSCGIFLGTSQSKTNIANEYYVEQGINSRTEATKGETNNFQTKGINSMQAEMVDAEDTSNVTNTMASAPQPIIITNLYTNKEEGNKIIISDNSPNVNAIKGNSPEIVNKYQDRSNINQPANYYNNSRHASTGAPYWLIVVCAIIIPPLGVALMWGITDKFWICLALSLLFWLPGMIYALIQVL